MATPSPAAVPSSTVVSATARPELTYPATEVSAKTNRRRFALKYTRKIVASATRLPSGDVSALLRRKSRYSLHLSNWGRHVEAPDAQTPEAFRRRKADPRRLDKLKIKRLESALARAQKQPAPAEAIIDIPKKTLRAVGATEQPSVAMSALPELSAAAGMARGCNGLGLSRAAIQRHKGRVPLPPRAPDKIHINLPQREATSIDTESH